MLLDESAKKKTKPHVPIYQNFAYQGWKQEKLLEEKEKSTRISSFSGIPLKIPFGGNFDDVDEASEYKSKEKEVPSPKKKISESTLGTPTLRRQIRGYMSSTSIPGAKNKLYEHESGSYTQRSAISAATPTMPPGTKTMFGGMGTVQSESFHAYMNKPKTMKQEPFVPSTKLTATAEAFKPQSKKFPSFYSSQMTSHIAEHPMSPPQAPAPPSSPNLMAYVYPQAYTPIYIPIIVQQPSTSRHSSYPYSAATTSNELLTGRIKFFDETQNYGFFTLDCNGSDLFVHYDDLLKSGITKEYVQKAKATGLRFAFRCVSYYGKYNLSYKAVDIQVIQDQTPQFTAPK